MIYRMTHMRCEEESPQYPIRTVDAEADSPETACRIAIKAILDSSTVAHEDRPRLGHLILDDLWIEEMSEGRLGVHEPQPDYAGLLQTPDAATVLFGTCSRTWSKSA